MGLTDWGQWSGRSIRLYQSDVAAMAHKNWPEALKDGPAPGPVTVTLTPEDLQQVIRGLALLNVFWREEEIHGRRPDDRPPRRNLDAIRDVYDRIEMAVAEMMEARQRG